MATRYPIQTLITSALTAGALGLASCAPIGVDEFEPIEFVPAAPDVQDVTVEHGDAARPESLSLCESPATFIPFENETERQVYDVLTAYKTGLTDTLERLTAK